MSTSTDRLLPIVFTELGRIVSDHDPLGLGPLLKVADGDETPIPCPCPYKKPIMEDDERCRHCNKQLKKPEPLERTTDKKDGPDKEDAGENETDGDSDSAPDTNDN